MESTVTTASAEYPDQPGSGIWRAVRWGLTTVGALALLTFFLAFGGTSTEAAAPTTPAATGDDAVYHTLACNVGNYSCVNTSVQACFNGNFSLCNANLGNFNTGYFGFGCALGNYVCPNGTPAFAFPYYANYYGNLNGYYRNYPYLAANYLGANYLGANYLGANYLGVNYLGANALPWYYGYYGTGVFTGNVNVVAPQGNALVVGPPYRVKEVATPTTAPTDAAPQPAAPAPVVAAAPVAAPAAPVAVAPAPEPVANMATALSAPTVASPDAGAASGGSGIHVLSAPTVAAPAATTESGGRDSR